MNPLPTIRPEWLGCLCDGGICRACRQARIQCDALLTSHIGLEIAGYVDSLIDIWQGSEECLEQIELHIESMYPEANSLLVALVLDQARGYIQSQAVAS